MSEKGRPNRLAKEKSPYLLEHAYNPVDWYPWGDEAIQRARAENKPIFLSIGYMSCHWCHRLRDESFENPEIAALMNERFVSIKVDREERPDVDEVYMKAVMAMTGSGGWPLSVFLTPNLKPYYGGTYFPPTRRGGMVSFPEVLNFAADLWKNNREQVLKNSDELTEHIQQSYIIEGGSELSRDLLESAYVELITSLDDQYGGFSVAPKFPLPNAIEFLLRYHARTKKEPALRAVRKTLENMTAGGIHDQVGGGFHRYSTDRFWLVPHFEKMLYDNALLAQVYTEAYQVTGDLSFLETAKDTLEWMLREMRGPEGGFYSAQDADTKDGEGYYYTWTPAEVEEAVGREAASSFCELFGVTKEGNFEGGRSIPHRTGSLARTASRLAVGTEVLGGSISATKAKLLEARRNRARPAVDDKVLTSWNGLAISAFARAYGAFGDEKYLEAGTKCASFVLSSLVVGGRVLRRYREREVAVEGTLEDYSFLVAGLIDLYEATFDIAWLRSALSVAENMIGHFWDDGGGAFFMNSSDEVIARIKDDYDGPLPSGNAVAIMSLLRLAEFTGRQDFRERAERGLKLFAPSMESSPSSHTFMLSALDFSFGAREIVLAGSPQDDSFQKMLHEIRRRYLPTKVLASGEGNPPELHQLTEGKSDLEGRPTVFICENFACKTPVTQLASLIKELDS